MIRGYGIQKVNLAIQKNKTKPEALDPKKNLEPH